jgi:hypothetical protein
MEKDIVLSANNDPKHTSKDVQKDLRKRLSWKNFIMAFIS